MAYKRGLNITDMNRCKTYVNQGHSAEEISRFLMIDLDIVSVFVEHYKNGGAAKKRPVDQITTEDVVEAKKPEKPKESEEESTPKKSRSRG